MNALIQGLLWLDAEPVRFRLLAGAVFAATAALAMAGGRGEGRAGRLAFGAGIILTLAAFRWPGWFVPHDLNPDEAQIVAGAITLREFPVYWLHVDGTTHGPVCEYLLVILSWFGAPLNYISARVLAGLLQAAALIATWRTLSYLVSERAARLTILPGLAFWSFVAFHDFVHYSTELPGIALTATGTWLLARVLAAGRESTPGGLLELAVGGSALGLVPLAKLQSAPPAAFVGAVALAFLGVRHARSGGWHRPAASLVAGGLVPAVVLAGFLWLHRLGADFRISYIDSTLAYSGGGHHSLAGMFAAFFSLAGVARAFALFLGGTIAFCLLGAYPAFRSAPALRPAQAAAAGFLLVSYLAVIFARRDVTHYLHLLVLPPCLLAGTLLGGAAAARSPLRGPRAAIAFLLLTVGPQVLHHDASWPIYSGRVAAHLHAPPTLTAGYLRREARPGDTLTVWGWEPNLFVETGLPQGTREAHTAWEISVAPYQGYYLQRYLDDLVRREPTWFVDAIHPGAFAFKDRAIFGHQAFEGVRRLVEDRYEFVAELSGRRIYRLKPKTRRRPRIAGCAIRKRC